MPAAVCAAAVISSVLLWQSERSGEQEKSVATVTETGEQETDHPVTFDNALLEQAVRAELGMPEGVITESDLERVEPCGNISDLSLLAKMLNLKELYLCGRHCAADSLYWK